MWFLPGRNRSGPPGGRNGGDAADELAGRVAELLDDHPHGVVEVAGDPLLADRLRERIGPRIAQDETPHPTAVVDATGSPHVIRSALHRLVDHGLLVLTTELRGNLEALNYYEDLHRRSLTVIGA